MKKEKTIDCLIIGHNEMDFPVYEEVIRKMGLNSGAYRDLNLNFIRFNGKPYNVSEIFNIFFYQDAKTADQEQFFHIAESFSAAIAYLGTYLNRRGFTFDYVNSFRNSKEELAEKLTQNNVLTIAITTTLYVSVLPILEIIEFIKNYNQEAKIIVGGPFVSTKVRTLPPEELKYLFETTIGADFYVNSSQGEAALVNIIKALKNNLPLDRVYNIYYKTPGGSIGTPVLREDNPLAENMVDWDLFGENVGEYVYVRTSISCPYSCSFCGFPHHAGAYQTAPVEKIEEEFKKLDRIKSVKSVRIVDDTFNIPVSRFKNILRMMIKNKFQFKWHGYFRCQFADPEMMELMKESNCEAVYLGLESGNNQILKNMNKNATIEKYLNGIRLLKEYGITIMGNFIIGFPGETEETVQDTVEFIEQSQMDFYHTQLWYGEPITPIWRKKEEFDIKGESFEWSHATMDFSKACDLIENIFLTVKSSTWVPQYSLDFDGLWHLTNRGMSLQQLKNYLESFNSAVREKLTDPSRKEVSYEALKQVQKACAIDEKYDESSNPPIENTSLHHSESSFEFL